MRRNIIFCQGVPVKLKLALSALVIGSAMPAMAEGWDGDAEAGAGVFFQCQTCHVVRDDDGELLAGAAGMVGPNLYGVADSAPGSREDYPRYSAALKLAKDKGLVWDAESLPAYIANPNGFLQSYLGDEYVPGTMPIGAPNPDAAANVAAYLNSLAE